MRLFGIAENISYSRHLVGLPDKILWRKSHWEVLWSGGRERNINILGCGLEFFILVPSLLSLEQVEVGFPGKNTRHPVKVGF